MTETSVATTEQVGADAFRIRTLDGDRWISQFVVLGEDATLLIDAGLPHSPEEAVLPFLEQHDRLDPDHPLIALITHPDSDHCGGTGALLEAAPWTTVYAHIRDRPQLGDAERTIRNRYLAYAADGVAPDETALARLRSRLGGDYAIDRWLATDADIQLDDSRRVRIVELPGHSPGHTGVWLEDERTLIAADALMGFGFPKCDGSLKIAPQFISPAVYLATLARIEALDPQTLLCTHEPTMTAAAVQSFVDDSREAAARLTELSLAAIGAEPISLMFVCEAVLRTYPQALPCGPADLAMAVAGIVEEAIAAGTVLASRERPRSFQRR